MPDPSRLFLFATILFAGLVSLPQEFSVGSVTGLGAGSTLICGAAWMLFAARPRLSRQHLPVLLPLIFFGVLVVGSLMWSGARVMQSMQLLCILLGFVGLTMLTTREVEDDPALAKKLHRVLDVATWFATALYAVSLVRDGLAAETIILARPYALFVLLGMARQIDLWQSGDRRGAIGAAIIAAVVLASISRTALAAALLMVPLAGLVQGGRKGVGLAVGSAVAGVLVVGAAVMLNEQIYERFFGFDASMQVGGVAINASGRTTMWLKLWENSWETPFFGKGVGEASNFIGYYFPYPGVGHPHNDYLRFFYEIGIVGLGLWTAFHVSCAVSLWKRARAALARGNGRYVYHVVPLLGLVALAISMSTDNAVAYAFVMTPLAIMLGCSLGLSSEPAKSTDPTFARQTSFAAQRQRSLWRRRMRAMTRAHPAADTPR